MSIKFSKQTQQWMDYFRSVDDPLTIIHNPLCDISGPMSMTTSEGCLDPFWSSFDHAIRMAKYHTILSKEEYEFWLDFVEEEEYPTEDELNRFVNICKEGTNAFKNANNCKFLSLTGLIEDIEGYWPYA